MSIMTQEPTENTQECPATEETALANTERAPAAPWKSTPMTPGATMLSFDPALAQEIGETKAIILQKIWDWMEYNRFKDRQDHLIDGQWYTYNSAKQWRDNHFMYLSVATVKAAFQWLEEQGYIQRIQPLKAFGDCRMWVTIPAAARSRIDAISAANTPDKKTPRGDKNSPTGDKKTPSLGEKDSPTIKNLQTENLQTKTPISEQQQPAATQPVVVEPALPPPFESESGEYPTDGEGHDTTAVKAFVPHEQHHDETPLQSSAKGSPQLVADLVDFGVLPHTAQRLAGAYREADIQHAVKIARVLDLGNPPGFVVRMLDTGQAHALRMPSAQARTTPLHEWVGTDGHVTWAPRDAPDLDAIRRENARMAAEEAEWDARARGA